MNITEKKLRREIKKIIKETHDVDESGHFQDNLNDAYNDRFMNLDRIVNELFDEARWLGGMGDSEVRGKVIKAINILQDAHAILDARNT